MPCICDSMLFQCHGLCIVGRPLLICLVCPQIVRRGRGCVLLQCMIAYGPGPILGLFQVLPGVGLVCTISAMSNLFLVFGVQLLWRSTIPWGDIPSWHKVGLGGRALPQGLTRPIGMPCLSCQ